MPAGTTVAISAYNNATTRQNLFNQTDLIVSARTGRFGHTLLVGTEFGRQETDNFRQTGFFSTLGANVTTFNAPLSAPTISLPVEFRQNATDADNHGVTTIAAAYAQDQIALSKHVEAVVGLRFDSFNANVTNNRTATDFASNDGLLSPRVGLIYKPIVPLSRVWQLQPDLPAARRRTAVVAVAHESGARSRRVPQLRSRREVGCRFRPSHSRRRCTVSIVATSSCPIPTIRRSRSWLTRSERKGLELGLNGNITRGVEHGGRLRLPGRRDYALDFRDGTGGSGAGPAAEALDFAVEQVRLHASRGRRAGRDLPQRRVHLDGQPVVLPGWTRVDAAVYYNLTSTDPRAGQHRESVR